MTRIDEIKNQIKELEEKKRINCQKQKELKQELTNYALEISDCHHKIKALYAEISTLMETSQTNVVIDDKNEVDDLI